MKTTLKVWQVRNGFLFIVLLGMIFAWEIELKAETKPQGAILPFIVRQDGDPGRGTLCPICKRIYRKGHILPGSQKILTRLLQQKIETLGTFKLLPLEKVEEALSYGDRKSLEENPFYASIQFGRRFNMDFIFIGFLFRFEERIGSSIGVEKPASVAFDIHLLRLKDGKNVWEGRFDETQRPLSENLLKVGSFLRRKASWLNAEELSSVGMDEVLEHLPSPKELEEMP